MDDDKNWLVLFLFFVGVWIFWALGGGPHTQPAAPSTLPTDSSIQGAPTVSAETDSSSTRQEQRTVEQELAYLQQRKDESLYASKVTVGYGSASSAQHPDQEYLELRASSQNTGGVPITGWTLTSEMSGKSVVIGEGTPLPYAGQVNSQQPIYLAPGETAIVTTGRSPIGTSFRLNLCTGYLEQFQNYSPMLPQYCPLPESELRQFGDGILAHQDACINYVSSMQRCSMQINALPQTITSECAQFISQNIHYSGCLKNHRSDPEFFSTTWRVFLNRDSELWKDRREIIRLLDQSGKTVDVLAY